jgi:hypothetical protein
LEISPFAKGKLQKMYKNIIGSDKWHRKNEIPEGQEYVDLTNFSEPWYPEDGPGKSFEYLYKINRNGEVVFLRISERDAEAMTKLKKENKAFKNVKVIDAFKLDSEGNLTGDLPPDVLKIFEDKNYDFIPAVTVNIQLPTQLVITSPKQKLLS